MRYFVLAVALLGLAACAQNHDGSHQDSASATTGRVSAQSYDDDGVAMLFSSASGSSFRLGSDDPNARSDVTIERDSVATYAEEDGIAFWNLPSFALTYASGGSGWTSRVDIYASGGEQLYNWKDQPGYLSNNLDLTNQEFTAYVRVHNIVDSARAQIALKIRGGRHTSSNPDLASCTMMTFSPASHGSITRFGKELTHPYYDYVRLPPEFSAALEENAWVGLKLVSWNDPADVTRVINRLYIDTSPFDDAGVPQNNWRLFSEYIDVDGVSTGNYYSTLVDWGGWQTTLRSDGFESIDFTLVSVREIEPPE